MPSPATRKASGKPRSSVREAAFRENGVNGEILCHLTADDLKEFGVVAVGPRRPLLVAIAELREDLHHGRRSDRPIIASTAATGRRQITVLFCDILGSTRSRRGWIRKNFAKS
jgi:class 3 adenylate cyclase